MVETLLPESTQLLLFRLNGKKMPHMVSRCVMRERSGHAVTLATP
jgi:hypothetical protein